MTPPLDYYAPPPRYNHTPTPKSTPRSTQPSRTITAPGQRILIYALPPLPTSPNSWCACYNENSIDARCCGLCYWFCPSTTIDRPECCHANFNLYWNSGCIQTESGNGNKYNNGCCTCFCLPIKFPLTILCCIGSSFNECANGWCNTGQLNYLF